jgi:hypothetical protein
VMYRHFGHLCFDAHLIVLRPALPAGLRRISTRQ